MESCKTSWLNQRVFGVRKKCTFTCTSWLASSSIEEATCLEVRLASSSLIIELICAIFIEALFDISLCIFVILCWVILLLSIILVVFLGQPYSPTPLGCIWALQLVSELGLLETKLNRLWSKDHGNH